MIKMEIDRCEMMLEMRGSDEMILKELALAVMRMLKAMEQSEGNPVSENLTCFVLGLLAEKEEQE